MAFFDDFDKKLILFGEDTIKKTKEIASMAKSSGEIRNEQIRRDELYKQLGIKYYELCFDNPKSELKDLCKEIAECSNKIQFLEEQNRIVAETEKCQICGSKVPANSAFCNSCGNPIVRMNQKKQHNQKGIICDQCGELVDSDSKFCTYCGGKLQTLEEETQILEESVLEEIQNSQIDKAIGKYCLGCGSEVREGQVFCIKCGKKL